MSIEKRRTTRGTVYDVRLRDLNGRQYKRSFRTRREAETFAAEERSRRVRGVPIDPWAGRTILSKYSSAWMSGRANLRPRTVELYTSLLKNHILPFLGDMELNDLTTLRVRAWHAELLRKGRLSPVTVAKCYRLLRAMLGTAVVDGVLARNPCVIKGASVERSPERPTATVGQVEAVATAVGERYRVLVLLATYGGLRLGELAGLTRQRIDLEEGTVEVAEQLQELTEGRCVVGPPKTEAGRRVVAIPPHLLPDLAVHLERFVDPEATALVFTAPEGGPLRRQNFRRRVWLLACAAVGVEGLHFHDLRHTGNTLAAATGASTKELMARMGHASPRAALIYQHATADRDAAIARALSDLVTSSSSPPPPATPRTDGRVLRLVKSRGMDEKGSGGNEHGVDDANPSTKCAMDVPWSPPNVPRRTRRKPVTRRNVVETMGLEPTTPCLQSRCSSS